MGGKFIRARLASDVACEVWSRAARVCCGFRLVIVTRCENNYFDTESITVKRFVLDECVPCGVLTRSLVIFNLVIETRKAALYACRTGLSSLLVRMKKNQDDSA